MNVDTLPPDIDDRQCLREQPRPALCQHGRVGELVLVYSAPNAIEGRLVQARLEDEGIPALIKGEGDGTYRTGGVDVWVSRDVEVQARLVLAAISSGDYELEADP